MARAQVNGVELWYQITGEGEPLIQVHGSVIGHVNFELVTPLLATEFRVIDLDQRGFGKSDRPIQEYTIETWAHDLAALLDVLEIESAHIHGTSMGGLIGIVFASEYPERVRGLVLDCTLARYDTASHINKRVRKALIAAYGWTDPVWDLLVVQDFSRSYIESERLEQGVAMLRRSLAAESPPELFLAISRAVETADVVPLLPDISAPTLVMIGEDDVLTPYELGSNGAGSKVILESIPGARLAPLPGCGHINLFEQPEESARIISEFLRSVT